MKKAFEIIDHTADIGIIAYGTDIEELFSNAALALFSLITEPESIEEKSHLNLKVTAKTEIACSLNGLMNSFTF